MIPGRQYPAVSNLLMSFAAEALFDFPRCRKRKSVAVIPPTRGCATADQRS